MFLTTAQANSKVRRGECSQVEAGNPLFLKYSQALQVFQQFYVHATQKMYNFPAVSELIA